MIILPLNTPENIRSIATQLDDGKADRFPKNPVNIPAYRSDGVNQKAGLPDPKKYPYSLIFVPDLSKLAVSDGENWYPITLGAPI